MAKFCQSCGAALTEGAKFCRSCGAKVAVPAPAPQTPGPKPAEAHRWKQPTVNAPNQVSSPTEKAPVPAAAPQTAEEIPRPTAATPKKPPRAVKKSAPEPKKTPKHPPKAVVTTAQQLLERTVSAQASGGEMSFVQPVLPVANALSPQGPIRCLLGGGVNVVKGLAAAVRDKKRWVPALALAVVWVLLTLLPALGFNPAPVRWLSFLSFAQGGMTGGVSGIVGGVIGKGVFAYFFTSVLLAPFGGKNPLRGMGGGIKRLFSSFAVKDKGSLIPLLSGFGAAFIFYNLMTADSSLQNSMAGIAAFVLCLRSLSGRAGFLRRFAVSLVSKRSGAFGAQEAANRLIAGLTGGFALSVPLSAIGFFAAGYVAGGLCLIAAVVFVFLSKSRREVTV